MNRFDRIAISILLALLLGGATLVIAQAAQPVAASTSTGPTAMTDENCMACHNAIAETWQGGKHAQSFSDEIFTKAWQEQGQPGACLVCHTTGYDPTTGTSALQSVSCTSCHNPIPANHPTDKMPVDNTPDLCGKCHSDPRFSTENWKLSAHSQQYDLLGVPRSTHRGDEGGGRRDHLHRRRI
jgi:predicted CXXCH cytochrome family protein